MFNYITGEKLQELTDHTIVFNNQLNIVVAATQLKNTKCEYYIFNGLAPINSLPDKILNARSLFVYIYALDMFFERIYPLLKNPFVLVSHNSDYEINEKYKKYLDENKIIRWYSQNVNLEHQKLISVPIGIANSQWEHGNLQLLDKIIGENNSKINLVYKNFDVHTAPMKRMEVLFDTNNIPLIRNRSQEQYLRDISMSKFNICPLGNGIDTHRMWESIYLGSIPIVQDCINNRNFEELPILLVNDWSTITNKFLEENFDEMTMTQKKYDYRKADLEYWREEINRQ